MAGDGRREEYQQRQQQTEGGDFVVFDLRSGASAGGPIDIFFVRALADQRRALFYSLWPYFPVTSITANKCLHSIHRKIIFPSYSCKTELLSLVSGTTAIRT